MALIEVEGRQVEYFQDGGGPDLLLLHTLLADASVYETILPRLAAKRRITRLSFPGFGASDPGPKTIDALADWTAAAIAALGLSPETDVFANGAGGFVAVGLAIRHGDRVNRLVIADSGAAFPQAAKVPLRGMAEKVRAGGIDTVLDIAVTRMFPQAYVDSHPDVIAERKARLKTVDPQAFADTCLALASLDHTGNLGRIENPVLVVVGLEDQTTPPAMSRALADGIVGARYDELAGVGHCPQIQDPDQLLAKIGPFLGLD